MPDPLFGECPYDPGNGGPSRGIEVQTVTLHRTIGRWAGDYSVGKNRDHNNGTFQFLIGQEPGQWVQFYRADRFCSHAAGSNEVGPGIELSGQNGEPLTDWQIEALGKILRWLRDEWGIAATFTEGDPRTYYDRTGPSGFVCHNSVAYPPAPSYHHHDYITADEFTRALAPTQEEEDVKGLLVADNTGAWWVLDTSGWKYRVFGPDVPVLAYLGLISSTTPGDMSAHPDVLARFRDVHAPGTGGGDVGAAGACNFVPAPTQFQAV
jgi:hypothetical protein